VESRDDVLLKAIRKRMNLDDILLFQIGLYSNSNVISWIQSIGIELATIEDWNYILKGLLAKTVDTDFITRLFAELAEKFWNFYDAKSMMEELLGSTAGYGNLVVFDYLCTHARVIFSKEVLSKIYDHCIDCAGAGNHLNIVKYIIDLNVPVYNFGPFNYDSYWDINAWGREGKECIDFLLQAGYIEQDIVIEWALHYNNFTYLEELEKRFANTEKRLKWSLVFGIATDRGPHKRNARAVLYCIKRIYGDTNIDEECISLLHNPNTISEILDTFMCHGFKEGFDFLIEKGLTSWKRIAQYIWQAALEDDETFWDTTDTTTTLMFESLEYCKEKITHKHFDFPTFEQILNHYIEKAKKSRTIWPNKYSVRLEPFVKWLNDNYK
jgi:hypothetical protein